MFAKRSIQNWKLFSVKPDYNDNICQFIKNKEYEKINMKI